MSGSIILHQELGVNPKLTFCPRCGGDAEELILIGARTRIDKCSECGTTVYGGISLRSPCRCGRRSSVTIGHIGKHDKLPASQPCAKCRAEIDNHKAVVAEGGIYWKCKECTREGVILARSKYAKAVRKQLKVKKPDPCGIEFEKCIEHTTS